MKIYGGGAAAIALKTGLSLEKAQECMEKYDAALPFVKKLSQIYQHQAERTGITEIMGGAKRHWNKFEAPWKGDTPCSLEEARLRVADPEHPWHGQKLRRAKTYRALNAAIQGDAAIHVKNWMLLCFREGITPSLQIHDELLCNVTTREQGEMIARLGEEAIKLSVPMRVDLKFGRNWADATHSWEELTGETTPVKPASPKPLNSTVTMTGPSEPAIAVSPEPSHRASPQARHPRQTCISNQPATRTSNRSRHASGNGHDTSPSRLAEPLPDGDRRVHQVWVTTFKDEFASSLQHDHLTLPEIAASIATTTAPTKGRAAAAEAATVWRPGDPQKLSAPQRQRAGNFRHRGRARQGDAVRLSMRSRYSARPASAASSTPARATSPARRNAGACWRRRRNFLRPSCEWAWWPASTASSTASSREPRASRCRRRSTMAASTTIRTTRSRCSTATSSICATIWRLARSSRTGPRPAIPPPTVTRKARQQGSGSLPSPGRISSSRSCSASRCTPRCWHLAAKMVAAGMDSAAVENFLRGLMEKSAAPRDARWQERYDDIPRLVASAEQFRPAVDRHLDVVRASEGASADRRPGAGRERRRAQAAARSGRWDGRRRR